MSRERAWSVPLDTLQYWLCVLLDEERYNRVSEAHGDLFIKYSGALHWLIKTSAKTTLKSTSL